MQSLRRQTPQLEYNYVTYWMYCYSGTDPENLEGDGWT